MIKKLAQTIAELPPSLRKAGYDAEDAATVHDDLFRRALFRTVNITSGATVRAITALFEGLTAASARSDVNAGRHIQRIVQHRQLQNRAAAARGAREDSPIAAGMRKQERLTRIAHLSCGLTYLAMLPTLKQQAEVVHGPFQFRTSMVPCGLDLRPAFEAVASHARRQRRRQPKDDYAVGYRKPPVATRFTAENNPAFSRKPAGAWDALDRSLHKPVILTKANGDKVSSTRLCAYYDGLIRKATTGDRAARSEVLRRILELDRKGLLTAPPRLKRMKRRAISKEDRQRVLEGAILIADHIRREAIRLFAASSGSDTGIVDYEHAALVEKARRARTKRAGQCHAVDTRDRRMDRQAKTGSKCTSGQRGGRDDAKQAKATSKQARSTKRQAMASASARLPSAEDAPLPILPTMMRTRAAPPPHLKHPALPRAKVSIVKAPLSRPPVVGTPGSKRRG